MDRKRLRRLASPRATAKALRWQLWLRSGPPQADLRLRALLRGDRPLVVGPWLSEVGFEVLYWIPMLTRLWHEHRVDSRRVTVVSRGGAGGWYGRVGRHYVDVLDHFDVDELREWQLRRHLEEGGQKHFALTSLDEEVLRRAASDLPDDHALIHPGMMYRRFLPYWSRRASWRSLHRRVRFAPMPEQPSPEALREHGLPEEYVTVKAYFSDCFPETEENRRFLWDLVSRLSRRTAVVLLDTGLALDDHADAAVAGQGRVISLAGAMRPNDNLAVQTAAIAGSRALFATYGGFAYLGPFLRVPTFSFYSKANFNETHLLAAHQASAKLGGGRFVPFHVDDYASLSAMADWHPVESA